MNEAQLYSLIRLQSRVRGIITRNKLRRIPKFHDFVQKYQKFEENYDNNRVKEIRK